MVPKLCFADSKGPATSSQVIGGCISEMAILILFYVLLTEHLSIILAIDQLNAQILFYNRFIIFLCMFRAQQCLKHAEEYDKPIIKQNLCIKLINF